MRRIPVFATIVVALAVAVMVALGVWQLGRMQQKEDLLAHYAQAQKSAAEVPWPRGEAAQADLLYRRARLQCERVVSHSGMAGRNARDEAGVAQTVQCLLPDGSRALVVLGWSRQPDAATTWEGGEVRGIVAPGPRLVADPPLGGLEANAIPDPAGIPNNHFSYAMQWFFFAATAVVIYALALRRRNRG